MVEIPETQGDATEVLKPAVDRLNRPVGRPGVEVGQHILAPASQRRCQLSQLLQPSRQTGPSLWGCQVNASQPDSEGPLNSLLFQISAVSLGISGALHPPYGRQLTSLYSGSTAGT